MSPIRPSRVKIFAACAVLCAVLLPTCKKSPGPGPAPAANGPTAPEGPRGEVPAPRPSPAEGGGAGSLVPEWVRPGLRMTFYLMTGSLSGSVNGWVPDEMGRWHDRYGRTYGTERQGYSSHGLIQATVVGGDGQTVALNEPFFLFNGLDTTPIYNMSLDALVTADTGGDYWMHPRRQALNLRQHPWGGPFVPGCIYCRAIPWTADDGRIYQATSIAILGDASRTTYVFDQATGYLLYLSRLTRQPPDIRDSSMTLPESASYATFLSLRGVRQLELPWLDAPPPDILRGAQALSYRGQFNLQGQGIVPTPLQVDSDLLVMRRGPDWMLLHGRTQTQGTMMPAEGNSVDGRGSLPPLGIAPSILAGLRPGQIIDRDPLSLFTVRVAGADAGTVTLQADGAVQSFTYVYDRARGLLVRRMSQDRGAGMGLVNVRDLRLAGIR